MATTIGLKVDDALRERLRSAAEASGRTPHALVKQALVAALQRLEDGAAIEAEAPPAAAPAPTEGGVQPFLAFAQSVRPQSVLRAQITAATRRPEPECLPLLVAEATLGPAQSEAAGVLARKLVQALRAKGTRSGVEALIQQFALSSQEGVALMCLAEALLRIPDRATRDALIRDKIAHGDWYAHVGQSPSLFVNAATWGLVVTGRLTATASEDGLSSALTRLITKGGEPVIRRGVDMAMRMMGEQFVTGRTISEALANARRLEGRGFRYSYDMLGEAAMTAADAARYLRDYEQAIHAIGQAAARRGIYEGPGISIKLSALHPRYSRAQRARVMAELLPRLEGLALLARRYDIGLNIDAEESDRLELSLDLLEALCFAPELSGWNGIGFVVQAYTKRAPFVLDAIVDLARRSGHRLMVRLVKGAYWDSEIKRAQTDGLEGFPVFTRKVHTDVSYLACARRLLAAPDAVFPQFATHNAYTVAAIHAMAGANFYRGQYEFQCLHGMGEPLYDEIVGGDKLDRPCRIYAPVGTHETLLAYLVRRLLENGANTSFVNRINDADVPVDALVADPVAEAAAIQPLGAPHPAIAHPRALLGSARANSAGLDLANEQRLASLSAALLASTTTPRRASPAGAEGEGTPVLNPADRRDVVGHVVEADAAAVEAALARAAAAAPIWQATPPEARAGVLLHAADLMEGRLQELIGLVVREAGKTFANAVAEVREAVDFLRYYAAQVRDGFSNDTHRPLGPVVCISPWNFPLAIFTGQVAAALAAGNSVLAKPAEETPLTAAAAVAILHGAGLPEGALSLVPGAGEVGASLVGDARVRGVMFTGSTEVARLIQRQLSARLSPEGRPIPLVAETGGQNALVVDSSALPEQVVADVLASAFDSAGQRCSALRVLCVQEDVADRVLAMLKGAMAELSLGNPDRLETDVGPVISQEARDGIRAHVAAMAGRGMPVFAQALPEACAPGTFVPPTLIEIAALADVEREVFGPVLHVLRYPRGGFDAVIAAVNATGYALTFGVHSRIDETIARATAQAEAGNVYVNRNLVGAVVGVQPFGGHGLSGTGPKAGGPLTLRRLLAHHPIALPPLGPEAAKASQKQGVDPEMTTRAAAAWTGFLDTHGFKPEAQACAALVREAPIDAPVFLPGPVGERNLYSLAPRGPVLCHARTRVGLAVQVGAALATGNRALVPARGTHDLPLARLPTALRARIVVTADDPIVGADPLGAVLFEGDGDALRHVGEALAARSGPIVPLYAPDTEAPDMVGAGYPPDWLVTERVVSVNTAAAGGNASLMTIG